MSCRAYACGPTRRSRSARIWERGLADLTIMAAKSRGNRRPPRPDSARFLAAEDGVGLHHLGGDVLETDRYLVDTLTELGAELVRHRGHVHGLDNRPTHAARLEEVEHQQRKHL